jgi:hypothetical protein
MSLVSVMVAIGLTGVLSVILMNLFDRQTQQQKKMMVDAELTEVYNHFQTVLSKKESCNASFMGKKKGQSIFRLLLTMNPDTPPFAEVDSPFRNTKIYLNSIRVLTDEEVLAMGRQLEDGIVVIDAEFERPENVLGGKTLRKQFDLRVVYGKEEMITHPVNESGVVALCKDDYGANSFIKSVKTGERADPEEDGVFPNGGGFEGMCVTPDPIGQTTPTSNINHCLTST